jgi:hypothetical protein
LNLFKELLMLGATWLELVRIFVFKLLFALFEGAGIGMLLPVLAGVEGKESRQLSNIWDSLSRGVRAMGIDERYEIVLLQDDFRDSHAEKRS